MDEYVKRQLSSVPGHIGFYYKNLVTGETDGSRQTELFQAASVIKLPILAAILLEEREQAELVRRALGELERPDRGLFVRHYYYGQTVARAAEEMSYATDYDEVVVNDDVDRCADEIYRLIQKHQHT